MKKIFRNSIYMLVAGALMASCADYNVTDDFHADPDPSVVRKYTEFNPVKSYIDRTANPNMAIGATTGLVDFLNMDRSHAAIMTNFDNVSFGKDLMMGTVVNDKGVMNFANLMLLLNHMDEIGGTVFGSPIVANASQADEWIDMLTAPIEVAVDFVEGKTVNFNDYNVGDEPGTNKVTAANQMSKIAKYDGQNALKIPSRGKVNIVEGFKLEPNATYTSTFWAKADADAYFYVNFSGNPIHGTATDDGRWLVAAGKWTKIIIEGKAPEGVTDGFLELETPRGYTLYLQKVEVGYYPDNHVEQTEKQKNDTIMYALDRWCDGIMNINEGRIKMFDLIDEPIDNTKKLLDKDIYDIKHSTTKRPFWQDVLGSENYAPVVAKKATEKFTEYGGKAEELKFFISETGLEDDTKMKSLEEWIKIWENKGAKIDGITAKMNLTFYENQEKLAAAKVAYETLLDNLAKTGKLIRLSNFDIKYTDETNQNVTAVKITDEQRQKLADFNAYAIKAYLNKIPKEKQAGICKNNLVDSSDPVGLWANDRTDGWIRNATYKAWCEALGGK